MIRSISSAPPSQRAVEHERAFRRWSMPVPVEAEADPSAPASFRVYTPAELRNVSLRSSRPSAGQVEGKSVATVPRSLLHWLAMGMAFGLLLVTVGVVALMSSDVPRSGTRTAGARLRQLVTPADPTPAEGDAAGAAPAEAALYFELPDDAPQPKARAKAKKSKLAVRAVPF
jgi:hypothetical protein